MNASKLLEDLSAQQMKLWVEDDRLQCQGQKHVLTPAFMEKMKTHKAGLLRLLKERAEKPSIERLSHGQQSLWYQYQLAPHSPAYNLSCLARFQAELNLDSLQQAFETLIKRHGILRTVYTTHAGKPVQQVQTFDQALRHRSDQKWFDVVDASHWSDTEFDNWLTAETERPFELEQGPVIRVAVIIKGSGAALEHEHLLVLVTHHIAADFWTLDILLEELCLIYDAIQSGTPARLAYTSLQYTDYVQWQAEMLAAQKGVQLRTYWQKQLAGDLPVLHLPTDFPRPPVQTYRSGIFEFSLETNLVREIQRLARVSDTTPYGIFLTALYILLFRYTGQDDILIGSPVAGRNWREFEQVLGYFVNPVVLRTDLSGNPTGQEALDRVRRTLLAALEHQEYPFQLLLEELQPLRDPGMSPVFQVSFSWDQSRRNQELQGADQADRSGRVIKEILAFEQRGAPFDLNLTIISANGCFNGRWQYSCDLFQADTMNRMTKHLLSLLQGITAHPERRITELPLLSKAEEHQVLVEFSHPAATYHATGTQEFPSREGSGVGSCPSRDKTLVDLFEAQVTRTPDAIAVVCDERQMTYRELNTRANRLAHTLFEMYQVQPEDRVGLLLSRSEWMIVGILGVLKAGAAYVPLDAQYPPERLGFILEDSACKVALSEAELLSLLNSAGQPVAVVDIHQLSHSGTGNPGRFGSPRSLAYVIYTSGSTGTPKGVMIEHRSVIHLMHGLYQYMYQRYACAPVMRVALMASFGFDASVQPVFSSLCYGYTLVIVNDSLKRDGQCLNRFFQERQLDITNCTPTLVGLMAAAEGFDGVKRQMKHLLVGGEALPPALAKELTGGENSVNVSNVYGPTEACVDATLYDLPAQLKLEQTSIPIGKPLPHIGVVILDPALQAVPVGVPGEICLTGVGLARGYLNRPALTQEKFIPFPFPEAVDQEGARLYRTGDRGRWRPDGTIEYLGRLDSQVKIRGYRIELGEIEERLRQHETVQDAVVVAKDFTGAGSQELAAYIIANEELRGREEKLTVHDLRGYLQQTLPDYMIPSYFIQLDQIPLTTHGKLDRKALPDPAETGMVSGTSYIAPRDEIERQLVQIWQEILLVSNVGIKDNFFALGGHSLKAIRAASRIQQVLGHELRLQPFFHHPTVETQAIYLRTQHPSAFVPIEPVSPASFYPVSHAQRRLWVLNQLDSDSAAYNMPSALTLEGELNREALIRSVEALIQRHESLRTVFTTVNGEPVQRILESYTPEVEALDLTQEARPEDRVRELTQARAGRPFDLTKGPLFKVSLLQIAARRYVLFFNMHHIISDGWSLNVLLRELGQLYEYFRLKIEDCRLKIEDPQSSIVNRQLSIANPLPSLRIQYKDFAAWQNRLLADDISTRHQAYWHDKLSGDIPVLELPTDFPHPSMQTFHGNVFSFTIEPVMLEQLHSFDRERGVSLFMTLIALVKVLLFRYTGQEDILLGSPIAGRNHADLEGQIGCYINTLTLRDQVCGEQSFELFLYQIKQTATEAYDHQLYPFDKLVEELDLRRELSRSPLFEVMVVLQNTEETTLSFESVKIAPFEITSRISKFALTFLFEEVPNGLRVNLEYNIDLFREDRIRRMGRHFFTLLKSILSQADQPINALNLLPEAELHQLLDEFNDTTVEYPCDKTIIDLFEAQVEQTPDKIAVVCENRQLSFREFNAQANRIAHFLRSAYSIQPDDRVAVLLDRSERLPLALLGILKAGGAYVPVDPAYPKERIHYILEKSGCQALLTESRYRVYAQEFFTAEICEIDTIQSENTTNPIHRVLSDRLAYVTYTSGSTGQPKGVMISHQNVVAFQANMGAVFGCDVSDRIAALTTVTFDISVLELLNSLMTGMSVVMSPDASLQDPETILQMIRTQAVSVLQVTPSRLKLLLERRDLSVLDSLDVLLIGGEALPQELFESLAPLLDRVSVFNVYGPTEATIWSTCKPLNDGTLNIGRPLLNESVYILSPAHSLLPVGVIGEIWIGGAGLARGYHQQPGMTSERFIRHSFREGERLYKTGDLGRWLPDGTLECLGRNDDQVKIRGYRVELGEIEHRLLEYEAVREAVVVAKDFSGDGVQELAAYVVTSEPSSVISNPSLEISEPSLLNTEHWSLNTLLREHLKKTLPEYMIPSYFVQIGTIPLTPNGKINRKALPHPLEAGMERETGYLAPRDEVEQELAQIWQEVLQVADVGIQDDFFELGGHSLKAIRIVGRIQQALGNELSLQTFFRHPTVEAQARHLRPQHPSAFIPIEPAPPASWYPVSYAQQRLWVLNQLDSDGAAYNMPDALMLEGDLKREALTWSVETLVQRHESLRTVFPTVNGEPVQRILESYAPEVKALDLTQEAQPEEQAQELARTEAVRPFDLSKGPLIRFSLLHIGEQRHVLLFNMHHIISDGWSLTILIRELCLLYNYYRLKSEECKLTIENPQPSIVNRQSSIPSPLTPLRLQYKDFAVWQNRLLDDEASAEHHRYWHNKLSGDIPVLDLPRDFRRPPVQTFTGDTVCGALTTTQSEHLKRFCHRQKVSLFILLLAGFKVLLYRLTGLENIIVGTPIAGRNYPELEHQIGFFVNTLALRDHVQGRSTFVDFLQQVKQTATEAYDHQPYLFDKLVDELDLQRDLSRTPLFQVFLNMLNLPEEPGITLEGIKMQRLSQTASGAKFDLTVYVHEQHNQIRFKLLYNTALFRQERMEEMLDQLRDLLFELTAHPQSPLDRFSLRTRRAQTILPDPTQALNASHAAAALHTLCSRQARRGAERPAVVDTYGILNYGELESLSNRVAHYLNASGIQSQAVVAIYGHRSNALVVAILGILKAGAAFLILDPDYPASWLAERIRKAEPRGLIHLEAARKIPDALEDCFSHSHCFCHLLLPKQLNSFSCIALNDYPDSPPDIQVKPDDLAYLVFTSGTTGRPQGILGTHRPLGHFIDWHVRSFDLTAEDRFSMLSGLSHDPLLRDIFTPLWLGATLYIPEPVYLKSTEQLADWLYERQISVMHLTPAMGQVLAETNSYAQFPSLRYLFFSGDVLKNAQVNRFRPLTPNASYVNFYGTTETPQAMSSFILPEHTALPETIPLGGGIDDVQMLVLTQARQLAGIGELGEIAVRTPYLAKGYLGEEGLNRSRFITNPFTGREEDRIYCTGDWGRYRPDGAIEFVGRQDAQMKIRGYRIEAREIEHQLRQHEAVQDAVLVAQDFRKDGEKELVAYIVTSDQDSVASNQDSGSSQQSVMTGKGTSLNTGHWSLNTVLREHLKQTLPEYMIPAYFVYVDKIPLTPNGKLDKLALPDPSETGLQYKTEYLAPRDMLELQIAQIWEQALDVFPVGVQDNFFELGGHSLKAVRLMAQIQQGFGGNLSLAILFQNPTVEEFANILRRNTEPLPWSSLVAIQHGNSIPPFFCVPGAGGNVIYLHNLAQHLGPEQPFYGLQAIGLDGVAAPHTSIETMAAHYLNSLQTVQPHGPYFLGGHSLGGKVAFEMARQLHQQGHEVALLAIFDTTAPPLISSVDTMDEARLLCEIATLYQRFSGKEAQVSYDEMLCLGWEEKLSYLQTCLQQVNLLSPDANIAPLRGHAQVYRTNRNLRYIPPKGTYPIPIALFKALESTVDRQTTSSGDANPFDDLSWGWERYSTEQVEIVEVPGDHLTMLTKPHVQVLAEKLKQRLEGMWKK